MVHRFKIHKQIHIAPVVESIRQNRPEDGESSDLMFPTKVDYPLDIQFNKLHGLLGFKCKDSYSFQYNKLL